MAVGACNTPPYSNRGSLPSPPPPPRSDHLLLPLQRPSLPESSAIDFACASLVLAGVASIASRGSSCATSPPNDTSSRENRHLKKHEPFIFQTAANETRYETRSERPAEKHAQKRTAQHPSSAVAKGEVTGRQT